MRQIRRCVIGTGADGQSYTQFDHNAPIGMTLGKTGAVGLLWKTLEMPVRNTGDSDQALGAFQPMPGPSGTVFGFSIFPPESEIGGEALAQDMKAAGGEQYEAHFTNRERHPGMHKTNTLDYNIILEGEIWLLAFYDGGPRPTVDDGEFVQALERLQEREEQLPARFDRRAVNAALSALRKERSCTSTSRS
jgi:naringenin degradation protein FdeH